MELLALVAIGAAAGWIAGGLIKQGGLGAVADTVGGAVVGVAAAYTLPHFGLFNMAGLVGEAISAALGAIVVVVILHLAVAN